VHAVTESLSTAHDAKLQSAFAAFRTDTQHLHAAALSDLSNKQATAIGAVSARQSAFETTIVARADALEARVTTAIETAQHTEHKDAEMAKIAAAEAMAAKGAIEAAALKAASDASASATAIVIQQQLQQQWNAESVQRASAQDAQVEALAADVVSVHSAVTAMRATVDETAAKQIAMGAEWAAIKTAHMQQLEMQQQQQQKSSDKASVLNEVENELVSAKLMVDVQNTMMQVWGVVEYVREVAIACFDQQFACVEHCSSRLFFDRRETSSVAHSVSLFLRTNRLAVCIHSPRTPAFRGDRLGARRAPRRPPERRAPLGRRASVGRARRAH
jgi:hypothetical protein